MTEPSTWRLFLAVAVPAEVLRVVDEAVAPHRERVSGARWAPLENQHVTLMFLGSVDAGTRDAVTDACSSVADRLAPAGVRVSGLGAFPTSRRARVLWAGLEDDEELLTRIASNLDETLGPIGFAAEKRAFTPHLTLARFRTPGAVGDMVNAVTLRTEAFAVEAFHMFRSHLSPKGARYEVVRSFVLAGESDS